MRLGSPSMAWRRSYCPALMLCRQLSVPHKAARMTPPHLLIGVSAGEPTRLRMPTALFNARSHHFGAAFSVSLHFAGLTRALDCLPSTQLSRHIFARHLPDNRLFHMPAAIAFVLIHALSTAYSGISSTGSRRTIGRYVVCFKGICSRRRIAAARI